MMKPYPFIAMLLTLLSVADVSAQTRVEDELTPYVEVLKTEGEDPLQFVIQKLKDVDLIIFDDALHTAAEPFEFYQKLIKTPQFHNRIDYIFLEIIPINKQQHIDAYLASDPEKVELLYPAFQNDFSGTGWPYQTYFDLLHTIYAVNRGLPEFERLKVLGVASPTYWPEIRTRQDFALFQKTLKSYDFTMYKSILFDMDDFKSGKKGIFLTNTRHAYKGIKNKQNEYYWNVGTLLHQWHPGHTYSIHFHNVSLYIVSNETVTMEWDRIASGMWDSAFAAYGNKPVAIPLRNNIFGSEPYIGNHMLNVAPNQTLYDAYDALIFLCPLEEMHKTAISDLIYTDEYKRELERRYKILFTEEQIQEQCKQYEADSLKELIDKTWVAEPQKPLPQVASICPIDEWK